VVEVPEGEGDEEDEDEDEEEGGWANRLVVVPTGKAVSSRN